MSLPRPITEGWALLAPLALAAVATRRHRLVSAAALAATAAVAAALRDPEREPPGTADALSPADARVMRISTVRDDHFGVEMLEISMFLALWHVHVQRAPLAGRLVDVRVTPGGHGNALFESSEGNFQQALSFETEWGPCVVTQVAGLLARRIVRWVEPGLSVAAGERLGMIKFGSRVVLRLPAGSHALVEVGQEVRAGLTPIARRPG
jgi:phosphatidylserine decarboxylase